MSQLLLTVLNPWQWFCSTRTLSNCLESTLTIVALYHWPWTWVEEAQTDLQDTTANIMDGQDEDYVHVAQGSPRLSEASTVLQTKEEDSLVERIEPSHSDSLRICLFCAAVACILRPTNVMIWISLSCFMFLRKTNYGFFTDIRWTNSPIWVDVTTLKFVCSTAQRWSFLREGVICG